jgi:flagellar biosynthesis GTPase FlhF
MDVVARQGLTWTRGQSVPHDLVVPSQHQLWISIHLIILYV